MSDRSAWTAGQRLGVSQLESLEACGSGIEILGLTFDEEHDSVTVCLSLPTTGIARGPGIQLMARERFSILIGRNFPFRPPSVFAQHTRWSGTPHVQWGCSLCLYAAPSTEWVPAAGIGGLLDRLLLWLERAAAGTLDADGVPVHPPVAYTGSASGTVVVRADLGSLAPWRQTPTTSEPLPLVALGSLTDDRLDVVEWMTVEAYRLAVTADAVPTDASGAPLVAAVALLLHGDIGFEYPKVATALRDGLATQGVAPETLLALIAVVADGNVRTAASRGIAKPEHGTEWPMGPGGVPQFVLVGTPSREIIPGERVAHLVAWRLDELGGAVTALLGDLMMETNSLFDDLRERVATLGKDWLGFAKVAWARVFEARPETTIRRDTGSPARDLNGKRILVLGCGALGAPIAEAAVRAGAAVTLVDNGIVTPGILVRQPYRDADIGRSKAFVLAARLRECQRGAAVEARADSVLTLLPSLLAGTGYDLVIDATADAGVRSALEADRTLNAESWPHLLTVLIGRQARRGVLALSRTGASGGGSDILRRLGIAARGRHAAALADVANDLYPIDPADNVFLPEPGCSSPTFTGSLSEVTALAHLMFASALDALDGRLKGPANDPMSVVAVRLESTDGLAERPSTSSSWVGWPNDHVAATVDGALQVRLSSAAIGSIRSEASRGARVRGHEIETGGMLLGAFDDATGVIYVDIAATPPPDSLHSDVYFQHGVDGAQEVVDHHLKATAGATAFIGMWHTHPDGVAKPSATDKIGMANVATPIVGGPPRCLMLIVGDRDPAWTQWVKGHEDSSAGLYLQVVERSTANGAAPRPQVPPSGTYFRGEQTVEVAAQPWWKQLFRGRQ